MLQIDTAACTTAEMLYRLWLHESARVWSDALVDRHDLTVFQRLLARALTTHWPTAIAAADILKVPTFARTESGGSGKQAAYVEVRLPLSCA